MNCLRKLLFCIGLVAVFLFGGCTGVPVKPTFEPESVTGNAVEQQTGRILSDSASDNVSDTAEAVSFAKADSVAEEQDPLAWEDIDWSQYDPQMVMLGQEIAHEWDPVRGVWYWKEFYYMRNVMAPIFGVTEEMLTVLPEFPAKRPQAGERVTEYLSAPYLLPGHDESRGPMDTDADGRVIRVFGEWYRSEPVNACCAKSLMDPHYVFLTRDGTFMRGDTRTDETHLLYDFRLDTAAVDKAIKLEQFGIDVRGSMIFVQFGDAVYCHYIPTGEMVHLFSVKNLKSFSFHNSCECSYTVHSEEYVAYVEAGGKPEEYPVQPLCAPSAPEPVTNMATQRSTLQIVFSDSGDNGTEDYHFRLADIRTPQQP